MKPTCLKLLASLLYEVMTVIALAFVGVGLFITLFGDASQDPVKRIAMQFFIWILLGAYYVWSWAVRGQSLAMRSWRLKLSTDGTNASVPFVTAVMRYLLATISVASLGLGFVWCLFDQRRRFLHDRLLNCQILQLSKK